MALYVGDDLVIGIGDEIKKLQVKKYPQGNKIERKTAKFATLEILLTSEVFKFYHLMGHNFNFTSARRGA